jgi:hypothetical protein
MERKYAPYQKWLGTAFRKLKCAGKLLPHLEGVLISKTWQERDRNLVPAYELIAAMHNDLGITDRLPSKSENFFGRPFKVIDLTGGFSRAIQAQISDPEIKRIAAKKLIGSIDQFSDSTELLSDATWRPILKRLYE